jgi:plasmid stabilization system protein ParE
VKSLRFHPKALAEYEAAAVWYAERSSVAALSFTALVDAAIDGVCDLPDAWPFWPGRSDVRSRVVQRVPYSIIYLVQDDAIIVVAVAHDKRRPGYWLRRLRR